MLVITPSGFRNKNTPRTSLSYRTDDYAAALVGRVREKYKLTQAKLGYLLGIGTQTIHKWERSKARPSLPIIMQLEMMEDGFAIPDRIRDRHLTRIRTGRKARKVRKGLSTSLTDTLMNPR